MTPVTIKGITYNFVRGSDVIRDGMYLEATREVSGRVTQLAEVFYSDQSHDIVISCYSPDLPLELVEHLIAQARLILP
jgi:hypothetical protein